MARVRRNITSYQGGGQTGTLEFNELLNPAAPIRVFFQPAEEQGTSR
jgi:hypothetical protein